MVWIEVSVTILIILLGWKLKKKTDLYYQRKLNMKKNLRRYDQLKSKRDDLARRLLVDGCLMTPERRQITELQTTDLLHKLQEGNFTALQVLHAFQAKALVATRVTNCITEFILEAEEWAADLDKSSTKGLLHGLPFSVKEPFDIAGYDSTVGLAKYVHCPADKTAALVETLRKKGAVPFCKTNIPQCAYSFECSNPLFGTTLHPSDPSRTCGGSSGGEAALIAAEGSILGLGSDLGGSLRIPAHFCGIVSLKPTSGRMSFLGSNVFRITGETVGTKCSVGCMGRDVSAVTVGTRGILQGQHMYEMDPNVIQIPWREEVFQRDRKLKIGYYEYNSCFPLTPGCRRAVMEAVSALSRAGNEVVHFNPPDLHEASRLTIGFLTADGCRGVIQSLIGEVVDPILDGVIKSTFVPYCLLGVVKKIVQLVSPTLAAVIKGGFSDGATITKELVNRRRYIDDLVARWKDLGLDGCITAGFPVPALPLGYAGEILPLVITSAVWNTMDFPVGIVPVTRETEEDQALLVHYPSCDMMFKKAKQGTRGSKGLPIGVQVIGLPYQEEMVLHVMKELEQALQLSSTGTVLQKIPNHRTTQHERIQYTADVS